MLEDIIEDLLRYGTNSCQNVNQIKQINILIKEEVPYTFPMCACSIDALNSSDTHFNNCHRVCSCFRGSCDREIENKRKLDVIQCNTSVSCPKISFTGHQIGRNFHVY